MAWPLPVRRSGEDGALSPSTLARMVLAQTLPCGFLKDKTLVFSDDPELVVAPYRGRWGFPPDLMCSFQFLRRKPHIGVDQKVLSMG